MPDRKALFGAHDHSMSRRNMVMHLDQDRVIFGISRVEETQNGTPSFRPLFMPAILSAYCRRFAFDVA